MENDRPRRMPNVPPFVKFVCANVPMVFDDSLSYYEAVCALWKYIQGMTDVINNNATLEEDYIEKFNELKTFVDEYFENLDVQEEINNKLDEMAEDGTLADIVAAYIQLRGILAYDSVADMKNATNLTNGSFAETYGFYAKGDGGSAKYKIRYITNDDTVDDATIISITADQSDTLIAELIPEDEMNVKQFGVTGDGTTDDTDRLQIALTFCSGKVLHFGKFTSGISEPLSATDLIIEGDDVTIKALAGFSGNYMLVPHNKISIKNAKFDANSVAKGCIGESDDNTYLNIDGCEFTGGIRYVSESNFALNSAVYATALEVNITNTNVHDNLSHGLMLKANTAHSKANIDNCQFNNNGSTTVGSEVLAVGLGGYGGLMGTYYDKVSISNCYATGNANTGIAPTSCNNVVLDNCVASLNGEHGICLQDGKNAVISNCLCDKNVKYGVRVQGDYNSTSEYHGYKDCIITDCLIIGNGVDIDEDIDGIKISNNKFVYAETGTGESIKGIRIGKLDKQDAYVKNAVITNNQFSGYASGNNILGFIDLDNKCVFDNYFDGQRVKQYHGGATYMMYDTCSTIEYGESDNILANPTNFSAWTMGGGATVSDNVITRGTSDLVATCTTVINTQPRFVSVIGKFSDYASDAEIGIGLRFRDADNTILGTQYYYAKVCKGNYQGIIFDLSKITGLTYSSIAKVDVLLRLTKGSIKMNYIYCALSDKLPILPNTIV